MMGKGDGEQGFWPASAASALPDVTSRKPGLAAGSGERSPGTVPGAPTSLEAERRKAMMLVHSAEKDLLHFKEKYFRNAKNRFNRLETVSLLQHVLERSEGRQPARSHWEFRQQYDKLRAPLQLLHPRQVAYMDAALERAAAFEELVLNVRQKLEDALDEHVGKYCHSFSAEAGENEIHAVQEYENNITRWRGVIRDSVGLLDDILKSISDAGPTFDVYVANYDKILHFMHLALEVFPRIYNPLKDWVTSDEAYVRKLQDEANETHRRRVQVAEVLRKGAMAADDMKTKVSRNYHQTTKLKERLARTMDQRKFCRRQEIILAENSTKLEEEISHKKQELDACLHSYYHRATNYSDAMFRRVMAKAASCQEELDKLEKRLDAVRVNLGKLRKERLAVQKEVHKLQTLYERSNQAGGFASHEAEERSRDVRGVQEEHRLLGEKLAALRTIRALKLSPNTVRKIHTQGYLPGRKLSVIDPLEEAFKVTAADIGKDWAFLYSKLPFTPERDLVTRSHDIQVIDLGSQKKDAGLRGAAARSLEKWKRLSQEASIDTLVKTLRTIKKQAVANKIEKQISTIAT